jgi:serine/threonine-protein kinase
VPDEATPERCEPLTAVLPREVAAYRIEEEIGRGGMGVVLRVRDGHLSRDLAAKVLLPEQLSREASVRRFLEEARITGQLQHPGVPPVHDLGRLADGRPYFTMKLVRGDTLTTLLRQRPEPAAERPRFLKIFEQLCQTVAYAHSKGVIHRDLKPANVMVGRFGEVQVMDWGLAKVLTKQASPRTQDEQVSPEAPSVIDSLRDSASELLTQAGSVMGTFAYMPPEQARGEAERLDERSDVFGLGAVLCVLLTGQPPYSSPDREVVRAKARRGDLGEAFAHLDGCGADAELVALAKRCLAVDMGDRPRNAGEAAQAVTAYLAAVEERARQAELERAAAQARAEEAKAKAAAERRARRLTVFLATAVLFLAAGVGGVAWLVQQQAADAAARQREAGAKAHAAMEQVRSKVRIGWESHHLGKLAEAHADMERAFDVASAAGAAIHAEAAALRQDVLAVLGRAKKNAELTTALLDVMVPRETRTYQRGEGGMMEARTQPSVDEQFAAAFRRWGTAIDLTPPQEILAKLQALPAPVTLEVVAGLEAWALERRRLRPASQWRRLLDLADQLDRDSRRQEVRRLLMANAVQQPAKAAPWEKARQRLRALARKAVPAKEPALGLVSLARGLNEFGEARVAEELLKSAVASRSQEVLLHVALGDLLASQRPPRWVEAVASYQAARALRPQLGVALGRALVEANRAKEGELVFRNHFAGQADNPESHFYLALALDGQKKSTAAEAAYREAIRLKPDYRDAHSNLGAVLGAQGRYREAETAYRKAILINSNSHISYSGLGIVLARQDRNKDAEAAFRKTIALRPDYGEAHHNLGNILGTQRRFKEAEAAYRKALNLLLDDPEVYAFLGAALTDQGRHQEGEAAIRQAIRLKPDYPDAHHNLAQALLTQRRFEEAERASREAIRLMPDWSQAHSTLGHALRDQGRAREAEAACRKAIEHQHDNAHAHNNLGVALSDQKRPKDAEEAYRTAIRFKPRFAQAFHNLGFALRDQGRLKEAEAATRRAIELEPEHAGAHNTLSGILIDQGRHEEAEEQCRAAIRLLPKEPKTYLILSRALCHQGRFKEAEAKCREALRLKRDDPDAFLGLGLALFEQRKLDEACAAYRKAIELNPSYSQAYNNLGNALTAQEKLGEAVAAFHKAIALKPEEASTHRNLGLALHKQRKPKEAEAAYRKALTLKENFPEVYSDLGIALSHLGRLDEAVATYRKGIALKPDYAPAHCNLGIALRRQRKLEESVVALRKADKLAPGNPIVTGHLRLTERYLELDRRLPALLAGKAQSANAAEHLEFAGFCAWYKRQHFAAVHLYAGAFAADAKLAANLQREYRYAAGSSAVLAAAGNGEDTKELAVEEWAWLQQRAHDWLRADLTAYSRFVEKGNQATRQLIHKRLAYWQIDPDLLAVRDPAWLAAMPEGDRAQWQQLWADIEVLRKKAAAK